MRAERSVILPSSDSQHEFEKVMGYNPLFQKRAGLLLESVNGWEAIR